MTRENFLSSVQTWFERGELQKVLANRISYKTEGDLPTVPQELWTYLQNEIAPYLEKIGFTSEIFSAGCAGSR
jgi:hypothetical protein